MFVKVATTDQVKPGRGFGAKLDKVFIGIYNVDGKYYAIDDVCPHMGGSLHHGFMNDCVVSCTLHMWEFDVKTGESVWPRYTRGTEGYRRSVRCAGMHVECLRSGSTRVAIAHRWQEAHPAMPTSGLASIEWSSTRLQLSAPRLGRHFTRQSSTKPRALRTQSHA